MLTTGSEVNTAISSFYLKVLLFIYLTHFFLTECKQVITGHKYEMCYFGGQENKHALAM